MWTFSSSAQLQLNSAAIKKINEIKPFDRCRCWQRWCMGLVRALPQWRGDGGTGQAELRDEQEVRRARLLRLSSRTHNLWFTGVVHVSRKRLTGKTKKMRMWEKRAWKFGLLRLNFGIWVWNDGIHFKNICLLFHRATTNRLPLQCNCVVIKSKDSSTQVKTKQCFCLLD